MKFIWLKFLMLLQEKVRDLHSGLCLRFLLNPNPQACRPCSYRKLTEQFPRFTARGRTPRSTLRRTLSDGCKLSSPIFLRSGEGQDVRYGLAPGVSPAGVRQSADVVAARDANATEHDEHPGPASGRGARGPLEGGPADVQGGVPTGALQRGRSATQSPTGDAKGAANSLIMLSAGQPKDGVQASGDAAAEKVPQASVGGTRKKPPSKALGSGARRTALVAGAVCGPPATKRSRFGPAPAAAAAAVSEPVRPVPDALAVATFAARALRGSASEANRAVLAPQQPAAALSKGTQRGRCGECGKRVKLCEEQPNVLCIACDARRMFTLAAQPAPAAAATAAIQASGALAAPAPASFAALGASGADRQAGAHAHQKRLGGLASLVSGGRRLSGNHVASVDAVDLTADETSEELPLAAALRVSKDRHRPPAGITIILLLFVVIALLLVLIMTKDGGWFVQVGTPARRFSRTCRPTCSDPLGRPGYRLP